MRWNSRHKNHNPSFFYYVLMLLGGSFMALLNTDPLQNLLRDIKCLEITLNLLVTIFQYLPNSCTILFTSWIDSTSILKFKRVAKLLKLKISVNKA